MEHSNLGIYFLFLAISWLEDLLPYILSFPKLDLSSIENEQFLMTFGLYFLRASS